MNDVIRLDIRPFKWQIESFNSWLQNSLRGILKVVTGAGKSFVGLMTIEYLWRIKNNPITVIIVPTKALQLQWQATLIKHGNVNPSSIGLHGGGAKVKNYKNTVFHIFVVNTARKYLENLKFMYPKNTKYFLITDECHRYASGSNKKIFDFKFDYTLGLSATPERENDFGFEKILIKNIGKIIYNYSYKNALEDKVISPFKLTNIKFKLTENESEEYDFISSKITDSLKKLKLKYPVLIRSNKFFAEINNIKNQQEENGSFADPIIAKFFNLTQRRMRLLHRADNRLNALANILERLSKYTKIMVFHELIEELEFIADFLRKKNINFRIYHSKMSEKDRNETLEHYRNSKSIVLLACKALDEGLDVPDTHIAILAASTKGTRQRIQRVGRVLRKSSGKDLAMIFTLYADETTEEGRYNIFEEQKLFGNEGIEYRSYPNDILV